MVFALLVDAQCGFKLGYKQLIAYLFELEMFPEKLKVVPTDRAFRNAFVLVHLKVRNPKSINDFA